MQTKTEPTSKHIVETKNQVPPCWREDAQAGRGGRLTSALQCLVQSNQDPVSGWSPGFLIQKECKGYKYTQSIFPQICIY